MAELVDALGLGPSEVTLVKVQVLFPAPQKRLNGVFALLVYLSLVISQRRLNGMFVDS